MNENEAIDFVVIIRKNKFYIELVTNIVVMGEE